MHAMKNEKEKAKELLAKSFELYKENGMKYWQEQVEKEIALL